MRGRNANLDLLRAAAIAMVVAHHLFLKWPVPRPHITAFTQYGEFGVDLFFVLSGWLIGGLFWREHQQFGNVMTARFIARRALRTVPPYAIALLVSYGAVKVFRNEPFDWRYLFFLQNYEASIPFFQVSWSLCIEEHFYLAMPLVALALTNFSARSHFVLPLLALLPLLFRAIHPWPAGEIPAFGYYFTATHLRYEGLLLGVWASYLFQCRPEIWRRLRAAAPYALPFAFLAAAVCAQLPSVWRYIFFYSAVSLFFWLLLIWAVDRKPFPFASSKAVLWIATLSYSAYLTNQLVIHFVTLAITKTGGQPEAVHFLAAAVCIAVAAVLFYRLVEAPSLIMRHWLSPARSAQASPLYETARANLGSPRSPR